MCSGEAQLLSERRTIPCLSISRNSFFAAASLSESNLLYLAVEGRPSVSMWWTTSCFTSGSSLEAFSTSGNSAKMVE